MRHVHKLKNFTIDTDDLVVLIKQTIFTAVDWDSCGNCAAAQLQFGSRFGKTWISHLESGQSFASSHVVQLYATDSIDPKDYLTSKKKSVTDVWAKQMDFLDWYIANKVDIDALTETAFNIAVAAAKAAAEE